MDKIKKFVNDHPQWTSWIVLAIGMVVILVWSARDVGLTGGQWAALIVATVLVAGLAVWIIGWEDEDEADEEVEKPGKKKDKKEKQHPQPKEKPAVDVISDVDVVSDVDDVIENSDEEAPAEQDLDETAAAEQDPA